MHELVKLAKGVIQPGDLTPGGTLRPEASERLISLVFDDPFLTKITTRRMGKLSADVMAFDVASRQLVRVPEGTEPSAAQIANGSGVGCTLRALPVQLFPTLSLSFLRDNANNPQLVSDVEASFARKFALEYLDLGFNGTNDDNSAGFLTLNKGWVQIASEATSDTVKVNIDPGANGWRASLKQLLDALPAQYRAQAAFIMNTGDADTYAMELGTHVTGSALVAESPLRRFLGVPIIDNPYMPAGKVLLTPPTNLVFGLHTEMVQTRRFNERARAVEWTFDTACDYEIVVKQACVYGY
ncbi:phage major capsid protein [Tepidiphilus succinatimandens]|uniref:phage major capsid family protein n=1 Tax=Tepidiphilus succinatimandens TaxID=224436 RepID=UPI00147701D8|nr:phage major capsid protein [Tepidiphilus succinatimandens]